MENRWIRCVIDNKRPPPDCSASNSSIWKLKLSPQPFTWLQVELLTLLTLHPSLHQSLEESWLRCVFLKEGMNIGVSSCLNGKRHLRDPTSLKTCCRQHGQIPPSNMCPPFLCAWGQPGGCVMVYSYGMQHCLSGYDETYTSVYAFEQI